MRRRYWARVVRFENTFLESILYREFIISSGSGSFAELLLNCLFNGTFLVISLKYHHFPGILLDRVLLHIRTSSSHLLRINLHGGLGPVTEYPLVADGMSIRLQE